MHYLCLVYHPAAPCAPPDGALLAEARAHGAELRRRGRALLAAAVLPDHGPASVRLRGGEILVEPAAAAGDGPSELYLIRAADLSAAVMVAAGLPAARGGHVELWPLELHGDA